MKESRRVFRDLAIALGVLALILGAVFAWLLLRPDAPRFAAEAPAEPITEETAPTSPEKEEKPAESDEPPMSGSVDRYIVDRHTVADGESFSLITGIHWGDIYLWPDLYVLNDMESSDPDLIFPEENVDIYNRLGDGDGFDDTERRAVLDSYIQVYDVYKSLGPEKNGSLWTLLWTATKYDREFLNSYASRIDAEDRAVAKRYVEEEGYLE